MIRYFFVFFISISLLFSSSVDKKIKKTSKQLHSFSKNYKRLNQQMAKTAEAIIQQKKAIQQRQKEIESLEKELQTKASSYTVSKKQLQALLQKQRELLSLQKKLQENLTFIIAQSVSLNVLLQRKFGKNIDSIIEFEILQGKLQEYKKQIQQLNKEYFNLNHNIDVVDSQAKTLKQSITLIDQKRKKLLAMQEKNKRALKELTLAKERYKKELKKLLKKQDELKRTLSRLKIIKIDEERRAREARERKAAFAKGAKPKVKQYGKSYQKIATQHYNGKKTIAPLRYYIITKKYGSYVDPIYGIKVFNESISMQPKYANAKVRNILNGKIIYAEKTALLDYVVIVEHKNGLHTIYANLSQLAPGIQKGKRVKKGHLLGRVKNELVFEVTQKEDHINPVELFR